jgi:DNA-directed RNA polymerase specialized sigma24 family protein
MESDNITKQKAHAIKSFIDKQPDTYLNMLHKTRLRLGTALGFNSRATTLAEGIMNEVFSDIIAGIRKWDMEKLKLEQVLWMNLRSEVSARVKKEKRYLPTPVVSEIGEDEQGRNIDDLVNTKPEDIEGAIDAKTIEAYCFDVILKDDEDAQIIFNEMLEGKKQQQISNELGIAMEETETTIRGIRRKIAKQIPRYMLLNLSQSLREKILNQT